MLVHFRAYRKQVAGAVGDESWLPVPAAEADRKTLVRRRAQSASGMSLLAVVVVVRLIIPILPLSFIVIRVKFISCVIFVVILLHDAQHLECDIPLVMNLVRDKPRKQRR